jgi:hypothetical protein
MQHTRSPARLSGTVTVVQERRFQLVDEGGVAHLFLLAVDAPVDLRALHDLAHSGERVSVSYHEAGSGLVAYTATNVEANR